MGAAGPKGTRLEELGLTASISVLAQLRQRLLPGLFALLVAPACAPPEPGRPNLVLITLDTFRQDRVGAYGHGGGLTPALDALAAESIVFENALTPIGSTLPAHASLFTGLYPGDHGVRWNGSPLAPDHETLAERLREAGYETAAFVGFRSMLTRGGLDQGFASASDRRGDERSGGYIRRGRRVNQLAKRWLDGEPGGPVFLWLHYFDSHAPYALTEHAAERLRDYDGPLASGASIKDFYSFREGGERPITENDRRALSALYDGEVLELDAVVGDMLADLRDQGLLDNAVVVVTADHGQLLGEHADVGHGSRVWEPVLRVPLMVWRSGEAPAARRVAPRVSLLDLHPTLLELAGLPVPPGTSGRSLVPALQGGELEPVDHFAAVSLKEGVAELPRPDEYDRSVAVYRGPYKLILSAEEARLFDVRADPGELRRLEVEPGRSEVLRALRSLAIAHRRRERPELDALDLAPEVADELRSLGYID